MVAPRAIRPTRHSSCESAGIPSRVSSRRNFCSRLSARTPVRGSTPWLPSGREICPRPWPRAFFTTAGSVPPVKSSWRGRCWPSSDRISHSACICAAFSSNVMRGTRSFTRSGTERVLSWYGRAMAPSPWGSGRRHILMAATLTAGSSGARASGSGIGLCCSSPKRLLRHSKGPDMKTPPVPGTWRPLAGVLGGLLAVLAPLPAHAQPSGGPYGPIPQTYALPDKAAHVYYVAPDGRKDATGTTLAEPTTLEAAIERVVSGDAIVMRGGTYRSGGLRLNQGITLQPYADERPVLKGTRVATEWQALRNNVWRTSWPTLFPARPLGWWQRAREGMRTPLPRFNNDMVFVDGELLKSAGWEGELDAHSFYVDYEAGQVYIGVDPTGRRVEIP